MNDYPPFPMMLFVSAISYAAIKHDGQKRKNSKRDPYITHPISVALYLMAVGIKDFVVLSAAVLHDVVEDTGATIEDVRALFGDDIARIVAEVTDDRSLSQVARKKAQLAHAKTLSKEAALVKLADAYDNLKSLCDDPPVGWSPEKVQGYMAWKMAIVAELAGTDAALEEKLQAVFQSSFRRGDQVFPAVPATPSLGEQLEAYYSLCEREEANKKSAN
jgi:GTP diphosphokinase / guanosine-3',5'-bis(diphosphate) 3'-diphosphatase